MKLISSIKKTGPFAVAAFLVSMQTGTLKAAPSILVDNSRELGGEDRISRFLGVQGDPYDGNDPKEAAAWHDLHLFSDTLLQIFDQDGYNSAGMQAYRGADRPTPTAKQVGGTDLWIDPAKFEERVRYIREKLKVDPRRMVLSINMMPKVLAGLPNDPAQAEKIQSSPGWWASRNPRDMNEWTAVLKKVGESLCERGFCDREAPPARVMLFHEAESDPGFLGNRVEKSDWGTLDDYVDLYAATQDALQSVMRIPEPVTIYASGTGVYSGELHTQISGYERPLNGDHIIRRFHERHPGKHFSGFAYQVYRFGGDNLVLGDGTIRVGAEYLKNKLASHGSPDVRIACFGYSGSGGHRNLNLPKEASVEVREALRKENAPRLVLEEAAFLAANLADVLNPKVDHPLYEATYYSFNFDMPNTEKCNPDGNFVFTSLVSTVHGGYDGCDPQYGESTVHCLRPMGVVMKAVADARTGKFIDLTLSAPDRRFQALAIRLPDNRIQILFSHRDGKNIPSTNLAISGLEAGKKYLISAQTLNVKLDLCSSWQKEREKSVNADGAGKARVVLDEMSSPVSLVEVKMNSKQ